jgi:uncharacterized membrane protein YfcA
MTALATVTILAGAFAGGFVSGLAGFGTALVALGIWLYVLPPAIASSLVIVCSVVAQCQTIRTIWHAIDLRTLWPMLAAGIVGVPIGTGLVGRIDPQTFRIAVGGVLIAFATTMLAGRARFTIVWGGRSADAAVGLCGGVLGGLAGLSGVLPTIWAALRGWSKDRRRGVFQAYNLTILGVSLATHVVDGQMTGEVGWLLLWALPGTLSGAWLGARAYRRISDRLFAQIVLGLLGFSGVTLIWSGVFRR